MPLPEVLGPPMPEAERKRRIATNLQELARRRKEGELDPQDFELNYLSYLENSPLTRSDLTRFSSVPTGQALVMTQIELETLTDFTGHPLRLLLATGQIIDIEPQTTGYDPTDVLVIFPEELALSFDQS